MSQIAADFGFRNTGRFRQAFLARFGLAPEDASGQGPHAASLLDSDNFLSTHFAAHSHRPNVA
jgi:AraC-like DNA-binding protein